MLNIRRADAADVALLLQLIQELADYERMPNAVVATTNDLLRDGWGPAPKFRCVIAEWRNEGGAEAPGWHTAGFALFFYNYSTFHGSSGLYIEDLFVRPEFRRRGIGKALLAYLAELALREFCSGLQWQVLDWNTSSIEFYKRLGAHFTKEWLTMRLDGGPLQKLAMSDFQSGLNPGV